MSQPIKFHRVASTTTTPVGGWKKGHVYFVYNTDGTGVLKVCTADGTAFVGEDYTQAGANNHNHSSNQVTRMTGYTKADSISPIATTDTLNQAIGKLEKTIDDIELLLSRI